MVVLRCKVLLLGDSKVGKTSLARQFTASQFHEEYEMTRGCSVLIKSIEKSIGEEEFEKKTKDKNKIEFHIYDVGGHPMYEEFLPKYVEGANFFVLVYDVTRISTFENLAKKWMKFCKGKGSYVVKSSLPRGFVVGNKNDLKREQEVEIMAGKDFASKNGMEFFEMSSADGEESRGIFERMGDIFLKKYAEVIEQVQYMTENS